MAFQKGMPRHPNAGCKKGVKNKNKVVKVADYLSEKGINPIQEILDQIELLDDGFTKLRAWFDVLSYYQGKPRDVVEDDSSSDDDLLEDFKDITSEQLLKIVKRDTEGA